MLPANKLFEVKTLLHFWNNVPLWYQTKLLTRILYDVKALIKSYSKYTKVSMVNANKHTGLNKRKNECFYL